MLPRLFLAAEMAVAQARGGRETHAQAGQSRLRAVAGRNSATSGHHFVGPMLHPRSSRHHGRCPFLQPLAFSGDCNVGIHSFYLFFQICTSSCSEYRIFLTSTYAILTLAK